MIYANIYNSKIGPLYIKAQNEKIIKIQLVNESFINKYKPSKLTDKAYREISDFLDGKINKIKVPYKINGTKFQKSVLNIISTVDYGSTISYKDIGNKLNLKAYQAIGSAVGSNPLLILIPCHRIIKSNGEIGGFSSGINLKIKLLEIEKKNLKKFSQ